MNLSNIFVQILNMSITAAFVIPVVLLVRVFIRNFPKKYSFLLWIIVGIRLICPTAISSPFSIFNLDNTNGTGMYVSAINREKLSDRNDAAAKTTLGEIHKIQTSMHAPVLSKDKENSLLVQAAAEEDTKNNFSKTDILQMAAMIWLLGMGLILFWNLYLLFRVKGRLHKAVRYDGNIYECDNIASPFVIGLIKPRIYIPFRLLPEERKYIVRHEQYHVHRKDYITKFLALIIMAIHWFNPLVWASYLCIAQDMEMSCDEYVLSEMGEDIKKEYCKSLLAFAANQRRISMGMPAFGERDTRRRVKNIMKFKQKGKWMGIPGAAILFVVGIVCLTNGKPSKAHADLTKSSAKMQKEDHTADIEDEEQFHTSEDNKYAYSNDEIQESLNFDTTTLSEIRKSGPSDTILENEGESITTYFSIIDEISKNEDAYGGMYLDYFGNLHVLLVEGADVQPCKDLINAHSAENQNVTYHTVKYSYKRLSEIQNLLTDHAAELDIIGTAIMEKENIVEVFCRSKEPDINKIIELAGAEDCLKILGGVEFILE